jgi:hypothetical protein
MLISYEKKKFLQQEKQVKYKPMSSNFAILEVRKYNCDPVRQHRLTLLLKYIVTLWENQVMSFQGICCVDV